MPTRANPPPASDEQVRALLEKYQCLVPFHEVRTRFLGNIASPIVSASPIKVVEDLWGGELPTFDAIDEANELIGALVMGLWNRLTRHQERSSPFRLLRMEAAPTRAGLAALAQMRRQELDGFIEGLFGHEEMIDLRKRAHRGLDDLGRMRALFEAVVVLAMDDAKPVTHAAIVSIPPTGESPTRVTEVSIERSYGPPTPGAAGHATAVDLGAR